MTLLVNFTYSQSHPPNSMSGEHTQELVLGYGTHKITQRFSGASTATSEARESGAADVCLYSIIADVSEVTRNTKFIKIDHQVVDGEDIEMAGRINLSPYTWGAGL